MSQGATFMRPRAMAWGQAGQPPADPATPAAELARRMPSGVGIALNPGQVNAWISAYAEPFYIRS